MLRKISSKTAAAVIAIYCMLCCIACRDGKQQQQMQDAMQQSIERSAAIIEMASRQAFNKMEQEAEDPVSAKTVRMWLPFVKECRNQTAQVTGMLNRLKESILRMDHAASLMKDSGAALYQQLYNFKDNVLNLHPESKQALAKRIFVLSPQLDLLGQQGFMRLLLQNTEQAAALKFIYLLQNNVNIIAYETVMFFNSKTTGCILRYDYFSALVGQNSTILQPGEDLKITAGIGAFSLAASPQIKINGQNIQLSTGQGYAEYAQKAPQQKGLHHVPVSINYIDQNGQKQSITQTVTYKVVAKD